MTAKNNKEESSRMIKPVEYLWMAGCIFFISIYPFLLMPHGLDFKDSFIHLTGYTGQRLSNLTATNAMTFLFPLPGKIWLQFAPDTLYSFRVMSTSLWVLMQIIPIALVLSMLQAKRKEVLLMMALGVIVAVGVPRGLGYDLVAGFWGSLIFTSAAFYIWRGGWFKLFLLGVLVAAFAGTRLPNVVILGPLLLVIIWKSREEAERLSLLSGRIILLLLSFLTAYFFLYLTLGTNTYEGSVVESLSMYFKKLFEVNPGSGGSHSLGNLLNNYFRDGKKMLVIMGVLLGFAAVWKLVVAGVTRGVMILAGMTVVLWVYIWQNLSGVPYSWHYSLFASTCTWVSFLGLAYFSWKERRVSWLMLGMLGFSFGWVSALGSNTGLLKMLWSYSYILPIFIWFLWKHAASVDRKLVLALGITLALFAVSEYLVLGSRNEDGRWYRLNAEVNHPQLKGIKTSEARKAVLEEILGHISEIKRREPEAKFVYHGRFAWIFRYLDKDADFYNKNFRMLYDDAEETALLSDYLQGLSRKHYVLLVFGYPESRRASANGLVGEMLNQRKYRLHAEGVNYQIFASGGGE